MNRSIKIMVVLLCVILAIPAVAGAAEAAEPAAEAVLAAPRYLDPAYFVPHFNTTMSMLAEQYHETLGDDGVNILNTYFVLTDTDRQLMNSDPAGTIFYYSNPDWNVEAQFTYVGDVASSDGPASSLNLSITSEVPEVAAYFSELILKAMIVTEYGDPETEKAIVNWFDTAESPGDILTLPDGYSLNRIRFETQTTYAVLPQTNPFGPAE